MTPKTRKKWDAAKSDLDLAILRRLKNRTDQAAAKEVLAARRAFDAIDKVARKEHDAEYQELLKKEKQAPNPRRLWQGLNGTK